MNHIYTIEKIIDGKIILNTHIPTEESVNKDFYCKLNTITTNSINFLSDVISNLNKESLLFLTIKELTRENKQELLSYLKNDSIIFIPKKMLNIYLGDYFYTDITLTENDVYIKVFKNFESVIEDDEGNHTPAINFYSKNDTYNKHYKSTALFNSVNKVDKEYPNVVVSEKVNTPQENFIKDCLVKGLGGVYKLNNTSIVIGFDFHFTNLKKNIEILDINSIDKKIYTNISDLGLNIYFEDFVYKKVLQFLKDTLQVDSLDISKNVIFISDKFMLATQKLHWLHFYRKIEIHKMENSFKLLKSVEKSDSLLYKKYKNLCSLFNATIAHDDNDIENSFCVYKNTIVTPMHTFRFYTNKKLSNHDVGNINKFRTFLKDTIFFNNEEITLSINVINYKSLDFKINSLCKLYIINQEDIDKDKHVLIVNGKEYFLTTRYNNGRRIGINIYKRLLENIHISNIEYKFVFLDKNKKLVIYTNEKEN